MDGSDLTIIHLSDLHLREGTRYETNNILRTLLSDIESRIKVNGFNNIHVIITGDLTYSGKREEFELVGEFSKTLEEAIEVERIIYSPGNHDLDWTMHTGYNKDLMEDLVEQGETGVERVEEKFSSTTDRPTLRSGMANYYAFLDSVGQKYSDYLYSIYSEEIERFKVNFISFNSAYLFSKKHSYYGYIGLTQIDRATNEADEIGNLKKDYRVFNVSAFHHPFESIVPVSQETTETLMKSRSDLILTGHVHSLRAYMDITASLIGPHNTRGHPLVSSTRCVYDEVRDPHIVPGYAIIGVTFDYNKINPIRLYEVAYDKNRMVWFRDPNNPSFPYLVDTAFTSAMLRDQGSLIAKLKIGDISDVADWGWKGEDLVGELMKIDYDVIENLTSENEGTLETWSAIRFDHPDTWRILYSASKSIEGYWSYVPLYAEDFKRLMSGEILEGEITTEMVPAMEMPGHYDMFFTTLALRKKYRGTQAIHMLYSSLLQVVRNLAENGVFFENLGTNAYTPAGMAVCRFFQMDYLRESPSKGKLFGKKFYPFPQNRVFLEHPDLGDMYRREFPDNST